MVFKPSQLDRSGFYIFLKTSLLWIHPLHWWVPIGTESQFRRQQIIHNQFLVVNTKAKTMTMTKWWFHFPNGTESGLDAINYTQLFSARPPRDSFSDKNFGPAFSSAINISKSVKLFPLRNNVAWCSFLAVFLHFCPFYCRWVGRRQ